MGAEEKERTLTYLGRLVNECKWDSSPIITGTRLDLTWLAVVSFRSALVFSIKVHNE
jgi:hypothetical protein